MISDYSVFGSKAAFNQALRHFKVVKGIAAKLGKSNFADLAQGMVDRDEVQIDQVPSIASALLVDKFEYQVKSINLPRNLTISEDACSSLAKWTSVELVCAYYDPNGSVAYFNPKNTEHIKKLNVLKKDELLVTYCLDKAAQNKKVALQAASDVLRALEGEVIDEAADYARPIQAKPAAAPKAAAKPAAGAKAAKAAPKAAPAEKFTGKLAKTQQLPVVVSNELFHNGNVEAWTRIIKSYHHKYAHSNVKVFYDGDLITDLMTLFQWGKVKRGTCIFFQVEAPEIKDIVKLKNYLYEGASERFENYLHGPPHKILKLF